MGPLVHQQNQFLYFDILSILPASANERSVTSDFAMPTPTRENAVVALFGSPFLRRVQQSVLSLIGTDATNIEVLKV